MNDSILIVEDDGLIALRIQELLAGEGYKVPQPVASGEEALARLSMELPDLVLMDIGLTGEIDGLVAARRIQTLADVPVIFVTAYADDRRISEARDISPFGYIVKPFRDEKLLETIRGALLLDATRKQGAQQPI